MPTGTKMPSLNKEQSRPATNEYHEVMSKQREMDEKYADLEEKANRAKMRLKVSLDDCMNDIGQGNSIGSKPPTTTAGRAWNN